VYGEGEEDEEGTFENHILERADQPVRRHRGRRRSSWSRPTTGPSSCPSSSLAAATCTARTSSGEDDPQILQPAAPRPPGDPPRRRRQHKKLPARRGRRRGFDAMLHKGKDGKIYNAGGCNGLSNLDVAKTSIKLLAPKTRTRAPPPPRAHATVPRARRRARRRAPRPARARSGARSGAGPDCGKEADGHGVRHCHWGGLSTGGEGRRAGRRLGGGAGRGGGGG
jgi:hypothetical protein